MDNGKVLGNAICRIDLVQTEAVKDASNVVAYALIDATRRGSASHSRRAATDRRVNASRAAADGHRHAGRVAANGEANGVILAWDDAERADG